MEIGPVVVGGICGAKLDSDHLGSQSACLLLSIIPPRVCVNPSHIYAGPALLADRARESIVGSPPP